MTAGGFSHTAGGKVNLLATAQALSALRLLYGDGLTVSAAGTQSPESSSPDEDTAVSDTASASSAPARSDGGTGGVITVVVVAVVRRGGAECVYKGQAFKAIRKINRLSRRGGIHSRRSRRDPRRGYAGVRAALAGAAVFFSVFIKRAGKWA